MGKTYKTVTSVWTAVFRRIVQQLTTDPKINSAIGWSNIRSWAGVPADRAPFEPNSQAPVIRLTPEPKNVSWYSEGAQWGTLDILVEIGVQSLCVDDVVDLYDTLVTALLATGRSLTPGNPTFRKDLTDIGAEDGEIVFAAPAYAARITEGSEGAFFGSGRMFIKVMRPA